MKYSSIRYFARQAYDHAMMHGQYQSMFRNDSVIAVYSPEHNAVVVSWGSGYRVVNVPKSWMGL